MVTRLLRQYRRDLGSVLGRIWPLVHADLYRRAVWLTDRGCPDETLSPTALTHELYLRLARSSSRPYRNSEHFLKMAVVAMRRLLINRAEARSARKRGDGKEVLPFDEARHVPARGRYTQEEWVLVAEVLDRLADRDARVARVLSYHYLFGMNRGEIAELTGLSDSTVKRDLVFGRAWVRTVLPADCR